MSNIKHLIFLILITIYRILPFKKWICFFLKRIGISNNKIYKDLKFKGFFKFQINEIQVSLFANNSTIENEIFWKGLGKTWEPETISFWEKIIPHVKTVFDIGANTGVYSILAKTINPMVKVYAFEPSKKVYSILQSNIERNKLDIKIYQLAISNTDNFQIFYDVKAHHQTSASLNPNKLKYNEKFKGVIHEYHVETIKLDSFLDRNNIETVDLLKIDVELHEFEVISGFARNIENYCPVIIIEILTNEIASKIQDFISKFHYDIYFLAEGEKPTKTNFIKPKDCFNYLLIPKSKIKMLKGADVI